MTDNRAEISRFPMARGSGCPLDPPPELARRLDQEPVSRVRLWDDSAPWLVTRYEDVRAVLADPGISSDSARPGFPYADEASKVRDASMKTIMQMDPPEHTAQRRMLTSEFTTRKMEALRPRIQKIVDDAIDSILAGPAPVDLVEAFALPVPAEVICELLGVPFADHAFFQEAARTLVMDDPDTDRAMAAGGGLHAYLEDLVVRKDAEPGEDLLSTLAVEQFRTGAMTPGEIAALAMLLLVGGHATIASMVTLGTVALLANPDQFRAVRDSDDPALVANAVEELLRYLTITESVPRVARTDLEVGDRVIPAGDGVIAVKSTANRDASAFPDPDVLDVHRKARHHVAFGHGRHLCLGAPLARVELQVIYGTLYRRIPTLAMAAPLEHLVFNEKAVFYTARELPVTW